jgi:hypothetical protein
LKNKRLYKITKQSLSISYLPFCAPQNCCWSWRGSIQEELISQVINKKIKIVIDIIFRIKSSRRSVTGTVRFSFLYTVCHFLHIINRHYFSSTKKKNSFNPERVWCQIPKGQFLNVKHNFMEFVTLIYILFNV